MTHSESTFTAIVLAADRTRKDPVASAGSVPFKCMVPVGGVPMVLRVIAALRACPRIGAIVLSGPPQELLADCPQLLQLIESGVVSWMANTDSPSRSAAAALNAVDANIPVLLTTADHALLDTAVVEEFLEQAGRLADDVAVGLVPAGIVEQAFPGVRRTILKFEDGGVCSCNLFAVKTVAGRELVSFWRRVERQRKHPWRLLAGLLGVGGAVLYVAGRLTLKSAAERISARLHLRVAAVLLGRPNAAVDVDTPADLALAQRYIEQQERDAAMSGDSGRST